MTYGLINSAIKKPTRGITALNGINIVWIFQNINLDTERLTAPHYVRLLLDYTEPESNSLGGSRDLLRHTGFINARVRSAKGQAGHSAYTIVDGLRELYDSKFITVTGNNQLKTRRFSITDAGMLDFYFIDMVLRFDYWEYV